MQGAMPMNTAMHVGRQSSERLSWAAMLLLLVPFTCRCEAADQPSPQWIHDALVVAMPAAAVGGCQAAVYTPAENGIRPWRQAIIRWLTSRSVRGNAAALVRQEGPEGGAGLSAIVDPRADYVFDVLVHVPDKGSFGDPQDKDLQILVTVFDVDGRILAETPVNKIPSDWAPAKVSFASGESREVLCVVHAKSPKRLPTLYFAEGFRLTRKDYAWWNPQNLFNASRTAARLPDERELLIKTLDPDVVAGHNGVYLNWDGYFTQRGIAAGGGHWEQEYNHLADDDAVVPQFQSAGMAKNLDGSVIRGYASRLWPGYNMCHNSPEWHGYYRQRLTRIAPDVQMISQDNICTPSFLAPGKGCFCQACRDGFRDWLRHRWTAQQCHTADIGDPGSLDIVEYVKKVQATTIARGPDAVLADPVLRAYIQFSYASQADRWRDTVAAIKQAAGHPIAVCGNQWGAGGARPYSGTLSQISDMTFTEAEADCLVPHKRAAAVLATKLGQAAGEYRRPVLLCLSSLFHAPQAAKSRLRMINEQAWADNGLPMPWATAAGASGWFYDTEAQLCRFVQQHRALFARRERVANVGLVYSFPSHAWRHFPAFGLLPKQHLQWFVACAQLLEECHIPYEANCWGHPLLADERVAMERLSRYQVLVLPGVDCFSNAQREAVRAFQARGGLVISVPCASVYDADGVSRPAGQTLATPGDRLIEIDPALLSRYARASDKPPIKTSAEDQSAGDQLRALVSHAVADRRLLETDAPTDLWANLWLDNTRQVLALHVVNGNIDQEADRFRPVDGSRWRVRLPAGLAVTEALAISPDEPQSKPLPVEIADNYATVVVPHIESYTVVALYSGKALAAANDLAQARRAMWRASVRDGKWDITPDAQLQKALSLLRAGQLDAGAAAALTRSNPEAASGGR
jgi:hypothetical protein